MHRKLRICLIIMADFRVTFNPQLTRCLQRNALKYKPQQPYGLNPGAFLKLHNILSSFVCCSLQVWVVVSSNPMRHTGNPKDSLSLLSITRGLTEWRKSVHRQGWVEY